MLPGTHATLKEAAKKAGVRLGAYLDALVKSTLIQGGSAKDLLEWEALTLSVTKDEMSREAVRKRRDALAKKLGLTPGD
jgi:hypothetical protein